MRKGINEGIEAWQSQNSQSTGIAIRQNLCLLNRKRKMRGTCSISSHVEVETTNSSC